jgi:protein-L-isoaspartate(D-aspartate) O-methyltransferase
LTGTRMSGIGMTSARTRDRLITRLREQGIASPSVLERIRAVPRHMFVDEALASRAYEDTALPIGHGQTISQPYIVARMTEALIEGGTPRKVLEVGTGCGYQTAVLAPLVATLYSIERIAALQLRARRAMRDLKITNVFMRHGDGFEGWPPYAPYDGIIVAAASMAIPAALLDQLGNGGRLIMPVGPDREQSLMRVTRRGESFEREVLGPATFVPLLQGLS